MPTLWNWPSCAMRLQWTNAGTPGYKSQWYATWIFYVQYVDVTLVRYEAKPDAFSHVFFYCSVLTYVYLPSLPLFPAFHLPVLFLIYAPPFPPSFPPHPPSFLTPFLNSLSLSLLIPSFLFSSLLYEFLSLSHFPPYPFFFAPSSINVYIYIPLHR